jgi:hypothetical protein
MHYILNYQLHAARMPTNYFISNFLFNPFFMKKCVQEIFVVSSIENEYYNL